MKIFIPMITLSLIISAVCCFKNIKNPMKTIGMFLLASFLITIFVTGIDFSIQTSDEEVWSGRIISVDHKEEWDEVVTETYTDDEGNSHTETHIEHHNAKNSIRTSDKGTITVNKSLDEKTHFDDSYPNTTQELEKFYPIGTPTSSVHTYKNKVQASYSIYKHKDINLEEYKDLPKYPTEMKNDIEIDRFIGNIKNKDKVIKCLNEVNSELNSKQNNKQVNLIFVNLGNKTEDYGFALQDYWEGGNKNDFVVCFGSKNNKVTWCYPFSWADSQKSERLKINIRNYMKEVNLNDDFNKNIKNIGDMIKKDFERKEFADFNYIDIEISKKAYVFIIILNIIAGYVILKEYN
ncbi:TPA: hypothetical protein PTV74_003241 [Clostridium botulinum]|nr:hypothetical protein [Clostridium botulinum]HDK7206395.1 hypothetical protein [Clostridium botulinum]HDK7210131.1 hypothetical protein [Clostridium botulinum]HDK7265580.1 hypothetical protein [Clostridium botulinum]HDK7269428.1 hypothetical protein [Clostridium botulinum]